MDELDYEKVVEWDDFKFRIWSNEGYDNTYCIELKNGFGLKIEITTIDETEILKLAEALKESVENIGRIRKLNQK